MKLLSFSLFCSVPFLCLVNVAAQSLVFAVSQDLTGKVVAIADGNTPSVLTKEKKQIRIRLAEIDAPERRQFFGTRAKETLADLCFGKILTSIYDSADSDGRLSPYSRRQPSDEGLGWCRADNQRSYLMFERGS